MTESEEQQMRRENIRLKGEAHTYRGLHARAVARNQELEGMISAIKEKVADLTRRPFGRKSEKMGPDRSAGKDAGGKNINPHFPTYLQLERSDWQLGPLCLRARVGNCH